MEIIEQLVDDINEKWQQFDEYVIDGNMPFILPMPLVAYSLTRFVINLNDVLGLDINAIADIMEEIEGKSGFMLKITLKMGGWEIKTSPHFPM